LQAAVEAVAQEDIAGEMERGLHMAAAVVLVEQLLCTIMELVHKHTVLLLDQAVAAAVELVAVVMVETQRLEH
jgi:hypothetical protein